MAIIMALTVLGYYLRFAEWAMFVGVFDEGKRYFALCAFVPVGNGNIAALEMNAATFHKSFCNFTAHTLVYPCKGRARNIH
jgi:hypothetical protein